jgi:putative transport protein
MNSDPLIPLFIIIGLGYLCGKLPIAMVRFGGACVLFVGIAAGIFLPTLTIPSIFTRFGLIIFVYTVGLQAGPGLRELFKKQGLRDSLLATLAIGLAMLLTYSMAWMLDLESPVRAGLFSGALTNTPSLAAITEALQALTNDEIILGLPVLAYSLAYPLGVFSVVFTFAIYRYWFRIEIPQKTEPVEPTVRSFSVQNPAVVGRNLREILSFRGELPFVITRIHRKNESLIAKGSSELQLNDIVVAVGEPDVMPLALQIFGSEAAHAQIDRELFDYRRTFISNPAIVGKKISDLKLIENYDAIITRLKRDEQDIVPVGSTRLHAGDRVRVFTKTQNMKAVRTYLGDSITGTAHPDFGSMAFGMTLGVLLGTLEVPLPMDKSFSLGMAGGPLVVALILGHLGSTGSIIWRMPLAANLTLRELGLLLFLAGVGLTAGSNFLHALQNFGPTVLLCAPIITMGVAGFTLLIGHKALKIPPDYLMGLVAGIHTQSASLAFIYSHTDSSRPSLAFANVFPTATILKILVAQLLLQF